MVSKSGHDHFVALSHRVDDFPTRIHASDIAQPALDHFNVNSEREHVQPADLDPLPPMRGRIRSSNMRR